MKILNTGFFWLFYFYFSDQLKNHGFFKSFFKLGIN
jgi:hypothetical protein